MARVTDNPICSINQVRVFLSFRSKCWSETGTEIATPSTRVRKLASKSDSTARFQVTKRAGSPRDASCLMTATSSGPMAGTPTSISSIPASAKARAIISLSGKVKATPGVCSPSLKVVSHNQICSDIKITPRLTLSQWHQRGIVDNGSSVAKSDSGVSGTPAFSRGKDLGAGQTCLGESRASNYAGGLLFL